MLFRSPDPTCSVDEDLVKPSLVRLVFGLIAQVPLSKDSSGVTCRFQNLGERCGFERQTFPFEDRVSYPVAEFMPTGHQC